MNLADPKSPLMSAAIVSALLVYFAPKLSWLPSELNAPIANVGGACAVLALLFLILDMVASLRRK